MKEEVGYKMITDLVMRLALVLGLLSLIGCENTEGIAKVNGETVSSAEFDAYLKVKRLPAKNAKQRERALKQFLDRTALAKGIETHGKLDLPTLRAEIDEFRKQLLINRYFEGFLKENVTPQAVLNYYNSNPDQFQEKRVHPAHILIRTNKAMDEAERQAKWTLAQEVYSKARAGTDYGQLAKDYSEDKISGKKGGDLGWLRAGAVGKVFSGKIFLMAEGELSEPFETPFGFHVVKILEGEQVIKKAFDSVKGDIRYQLRTQAKNAELERLKKDIKIEILKKNTDAN